MLGATLILTNKFGRPWKASNLSKQLGDALVDALIAEMRVGPERQPMDLHLAFEKGLGRIAVVVFQVEIAPSGGAGGADPLGQIWGSAARAVDLVARDQFPPILGRSNG